MYKYFININPQIHTILVEYKFVGLYLSKIYFKPIFVGIIMALIITSKTK